MFFFWIFVVEHSKPLLYLFLWIVWQFAMLSIIEVIEFDLSTENIYIGWQIAVRNVFYNYFSYIFQKYICYPVLNKYTRFKLI